MSTMSSQAPLAKLAATVVASVAATATAPVAEGGCQHTSTRTDQTCHTRYTVHSVSHKVNATSSHTAGYPMQHTSDSYGTLLGAAAVARACMLSLIHISEPTRPY